MSSRQRNQTEEDPEEGHALNYEGWILRQGESRNPYVRGSGRDGARLGVEECPGQKSCAGEPNKGREAHENVKELLDPQYEFHNSPPAISSQRMVMLSPAVGYGWNHPIDAANIDPEPPLSDCS